MCHYRSRPARWVTALLAVTSLVFFTSAAFAQPPSPAQEQPEVLSRGPVHEAFAEPVRLELQAGLVVPERPPPNIEEVPPAERPRGQQYVWIPGYWSWDADRNGHIWVSACWRVAPPRMSWVPGYWSQVSGGWEWVAGLWTPAGVREIEYLPAPPMAGDVEPQGPPPSPDTIWVPPCMYWAQGRYVRRDGYWLAAQADWVWVPSHYVMTPRGYIFADGHWDYSLERRGVLFAPIYFPAAYYGRSGISFSPSIVIDMGLLRLSLFAYPRYSHYYFGDYYDDAYLRIGIYPWFDSRRLHTWYDPIYEHDRWRNLRSEPRWEEHRRDEYSRRRADTNLRPARTFREQESRLAKLPEHQRRSLQVAEPITAVVARRETPMKFERINTDARQTISRQANSVRTFRDERNRWESTSASLQKTTPPPGDHKATVTPPIPERRETVKPPAKERDAVTLPAERRETVKHPAKERDAAVTPPAERAPPPQAPRDRGGAVTVPPAQRESVSAPPRESRQVSQPERVQIPSPPVVGRSGKQGIFQKGPPSRPDDESKDKQSRDHRKK